MANQYVNKVTVNGVNVIDLTGDTVTPDKLMAGYTAHDASGAPITGTASSGGGGIPSPIVAGDTPVYLDFSEYEHKGNSYAQISDTYTVQHAGTYRIKARVERANTGGSWGAAVYKNGMGVSGSNASWNGTAGTITCDVTCSAGDTLAIWGFSRGNLYAISSFGFSACIDWDNGF